MANNPFAVFEIRFCGAAIVPVASIVSYFMVIS